MDKTISERMLEGPVNEIAISLIVSKDIERENGETIPAVKKVSDKLTSVKAFLSGGRNADGSWGDSTSFDVNITSSTKLGEGVEIKPGEHLTFVGFLSARSYTNADNKKRTYSVIVAKEVIKTPMREKEEENQSNTSTSNAKADNTSSNIPTGEQVDKAMPDDLPWG